MGSFQTRTEGKGKMTACQVFPLGYCGSISVSVNLEELKKHPLPVLLE